MSAYFDKTFFRLFFGFVGILSVSLGLFVAVQYWNERQNPEVVYVEANESNRIENQIIIE